MSGGQIFVSWDGPGGDGYPSTRAAIASHLITANMKSRWLPFRERSMAHQIMAPGASNQSGGMRDCDRDAVAMYKQDPGTIGGT